MDKRRTRITALALAALLCLASCSGSGGESGEKDNASNEMPAGPTNAGPAKSSEPVSPQSVRVKGGKSLKTAVEEAQKHPFIVLITKRDCKACEQEEARIDKAWSDSGSKLPFFVLNADDKSKTDEYTPSELAAKLDVSKFEERGKGAPWSGVLNPKGEGKSDLVAEQKEVVAQIAESSKQVTGASPDRAAETGAGAGAGQDSQAEARLAKSETRLASLEKELNQIKEGQAGSGGTSALNKSLEDAVRKQQSLQTVVMIMAFLLVPAIVLSLFLFFRLAAMGREQQKIITALSGRDSDGAEEKIKAALEGQHEAIEGLRTTVEEAQRDVKALEPRVKIVEDRPVAGGDAGNGVITESIKQELVNAALDRLTLQVDDQLVQQLFSNTSFLQKLQQKLSHEFESRVNKELDEQFVQKFADQFTDLMDKQFGSRFEKIFGQTFDNKMAPVRTDMENKLLGDIRNVAEENQRVNGENKNTANAVVEMAQWLSSIQMEAMGSDGAASEAERGAAISILEHHHDRLRTNADLVAPLVEATQKLVERASSSQRTPAGVLDKLTELLDSIRRYDRWLEDAGKQVASLRNDSLSTRREEFERELEKLKFNYELCNKPAADFIKELHELHEKYFPAAMREGHHQPVPAVDVDELERRASNIENHLMDWFSDFFHVQTQMQYAQEIDNAGDTEVIAGMDKVKEAAREVLSNFDIQPDEIRIGQTQYDRNLHDLIYARDSKYEPRTIIEVEKSGFSRMSNGSSLRRPQVIISGVGAS